jgi:CheY-like chemotaxis protein
MTPHIMLVEDNPSDVELMRTAFEEIAIAAFYTVYRDGDAAIAGIRAFATRSEQPNLVLLDLNLARTSGHAVLVELRLHDRLRHVPVVVFSTSNHPTDRNRCLAAGADDYRVKPPHFDDLITLANDLRTRWLGGAP